MIYKVLNAVVKTTQAGKSYRVLSLEDETGASYEQVSIWSDNAEYVKAVPEGVIEGNIKTNDKGYKNFYAVTTGATSPNKASFSREMMKEKAESINHAQARKEEGIMVSSTFSSATAITVALIEKGEVLPADWEVSWIKTRHKLVKLWNHTQEEKTPGGADYPINTDESIPF